MTQNIITAEFEDDEKAYETLHRMQINASSNGYEIYQAALVRKDSGGTQIEEKFRTGILNRSHSFSDWALGALIGILFGLHGFLIGGMIGLFAGTVYDTVQLSHDNKLLQEAAKTAADDTQSLIIIADEKYEDALDHQLKCSRSAIHRAYAGDMDEEMKAKRLTNISMN
jgi:uncharacterized membrane protein